MSDRPWAYLGWNRRTLRRLRTSEAGPRVATAEILREAQERLRDPFLAAVAALERRLPAPHGLLLPAVERNPFVSDLFLRICLAWVANRLRGRGVDVRTDDALLAAHLGLGPPYAPPAPWMPAVRFLIERLRHRHRAGRNLGRSAPWPGPHRTSGPCLVALSWIDERSAAPGGGFRDTYLGDLPERLAEGLPIVHVALPASSAAERTRILQGGGRPGLLPERLLGPIDLLRAVREAARGASLDPGRFEVEGIDATPFAVADVAGAAAIRRSAEAWGYAAVAPALERLGLRPTRAVWPFENHLWERGFVRGMRRRFPDAELVGYQHAGLEPFYLSQWPLEPERPVLPDRILANSDATLAALSRAAPPGVRVEGGPAARIAPVARAPRSGAPPRILVALSIDLPSAAETVDRVAEAAPAAGAEIRLAAHPLAPREVVLAASSAGTLPPSIRWTDRPFAEELAEADALLYANTSACLIAVASGIPAFFLPLEGRLHTDPLHGTDRRAEVWTDSALRSLLSGRI